MGLHPPRVRYIKPYRYEVRSGDDVVSIAGAFGMPPGRWPELVGANPHKKLGEFGLRHKCFKSLRVSEPLNIPSCWREPRDARGQIGAPADGQLGIIDTLQEFQNVVRAVSAKFGVPDYLMNKIDDLAAVVYSWWKHLQVMQPGLPSTPPMAQPDLVNVVTQMGLPLWTNLLKSANEFLTHYGMPSGEVPQVQDIPWGDLPWVQLQHVWDQIPPSAWAQVSSVLANLPQPSHTTPPVLEQLPPSGLPNFFDPTTWQKPMYQKASLSEINWSDMMTEVFKDPRFVQCNVSKSDNLDKLKNCPQCYTNAKEFVDRFCADGDPCDCDEPGEPTPPPVQKEPEGKSNFMTYALIGTGVLGLIALGSVVASDR